MINKECKYAKIADPGSFEPDFRGSYILVLIHFEYVFIVFVFNIIDNSEKSCVICIKRCIFAIEKAIFAKQNYI